MNVSRIIRVIVLPLLAVALVVVAFVLQRLSISAELEERAYDRLEETAVQHKSEFENRVKIEFAFLTGLGSFVQERNEDLTIDELQELLSSFSGDALGEYLALNLADAQGRSFSSDGVIAQIADREYFQKAMQGESVIESIANGKLSNEPRIVLAVPIYDGQTIVGIVHGGFDPSTFESMMISPQYGGAATALLCNSSGDVLVANEDEMFSNAQTVFEVFGQGTFEEGFSNERLATALNLGEDGTFAIKFEQELYYITFTSTSFDDWYIISTVPARVVNDSFTFVNQNLVFVMVMLALAGAVVVLMVVLSNRQRIKVLRIEQERLRQTSEQMRTLAELADGVIFEMDFIKNSIVYNSNFEKLFGYAPTITNVDRFLEGSSHVYEDDIPTFMKLFDEVMAGADESMGELRVIMATGEPIWVRVEYHVMRASDGHPLKLIGKLSNIDDQKRDFLHLQVLAETDLMTSLYNQRSFRLKVEDLLDGDRRRGVCALIILDIDDFKHVNDTYGHAAGDLAIVRVAQTMREVFRTTDVLGRLGGDEYGIFLPTTTEEGARQKVEEFIARIAVLRIEATSNADSDANALSFAVNCSLGIAIGSATDTYDELFLRADKALYCVKGTNKGTYSFDKEG